jgi:hypothetical protein
MNLLRRLTLAVLALLVASNAATSQWNEYSSPDGAFKVHIPAKNMIAKRTVYAEHKGEFESDIGAVLVRCSTAVTMFTLPGGSEKSWFTVAEYEINGCERTSEEFYKETEMVYSIIGGDNRRLLSDQQSQMQGMKSHDVVYKNGSEIYGRAITLDGGNRIFRLVFDRRQYSVADEDRVVTSFSVPSKH